MTQFRPMLAATLESLNTLPYPVLVSPKMDGIRCLMSGGRALSRSLKPIPNEAVRAFLEALPDLEGLDGELMVHGLPFGEVSSVFMSRAKALPQQWYFAVFDALPLKPGEPYAARLVRVEQAVKKIANPHIVLVPQHTVHSAAEVEAFEESALKLGFEGVMVRRSGAPYKHGRSSVAEGALLKWKRFEDAEAEVIGCVELLHNGNAAFESETGHTKRSSAKAGKSVSGQLGALVVRDLVSGVTFEIGTGFSGADRKQLWQQRSTIMGRVAKYKHFPTGAKDKPRFPVFLGFRAPEDMH